MLALLFLSPGSNVINMADTVFLGTDVISMADIVIIWKLHLQNV